jgi:phosphotransferase system enzyme I (PtsI)
MIEIPAAALALGPFLRKLDFLSIGTNDLIQYTLAIDRTDEAVAHLYDPLHPAVLRLIRRPSRGAAGRHAGGRVRRNGRRSAPDPLLLGMGLRQFSMHPAQLLEVKQQVMMADASSSAGKRAKLLKLDEARQGSRAAGLGRPAGNSGRRRFDSACGRLG